MLNKIALLAASMTAALAIAGGLALAGFGVPSPAADMQAVDQVVVPADATVPSDAAAPVQVDTIYLAPQPTPEEITVTKIKEAKHQDGEHEGDEAGEAEDD